MLSKCPKRHFCLGGMARGVLKIFMPMRLLQLSLILLSSICYSSCVPIPIPYKVNYYPQFTGQLVDGGKQEPIENAEVIFILPSKKKIYETFSDNDGRFIVESKRTWRLMSILPLAPTTPRFFHQSTLIINFEKFNCSNTIHIPVVHSIPSYFVGDTGGFNRSKVYDVGTIQLGGHDPTKSFFAGRTFPYNEGTIRDICNRREDDFQSEVICLNNSESNLGFKEINDVTTTKVARLTGPEGSNAMNDTWRVGIGGMDLGHMVNVGGKTFFVFGDTFESSKPIGQNEGAGWRWNTLAWTKDTDPRDGITFDGWITDEAGRARAAIEDRRAAPITNIPTGGIAVGERIYLWFMAMKFWGTADDPCWRAHYSGLAWSDDEGRTFTVSEDFKFAEGSNFGMVAAAHGGDDPTLAAAGGDYTYIWGTPTNRCGGIALARMKESEVADQTKWQFYDGAAWSPRESNAAIIVPAPAGELSVMYNRWARSWIMLHITFQPGENPMLHPGRIVLRQAPEPWGPWSEPILVADNARFPGGLYGSYMNPRYVEDDGRVIYFTMSLWDPYDVFWMRAELKSE